jgi:hypothetical protein
VINPLSLAVRPHDRTVCSKNRKVKMAVAINKMVAVIK